MTSSTKSPLPLVFIGVGPTARTCPADAEISLPVRFASLRAADA